MAKWLDQLLLGATQGYLQGSIANQAQRKQKQAEKSQKEDEIRQSVSQISTAYRTAKDVRARDAVLYNYENVLKPYAKKYGVVVPDTLEGWTPDVGQMYDDWRQMPTPEGQQLNPAFGQQLFNKQYGLGEGASGGQALRGLMELFGTSIPGAQPPGMPDKNGDTWMPGGTGPIVPPQDDSMWRRGQRGWEIRIPGGDRTTGVKVNPNMPWANARPTPPPMRQPQEQDIPMLIPKTAKPMTEDQQYMRSNQLLNTLRPYLAVPADKRPVKIIAGITKQLSDLMGMELTVEDALQMASMSAYQQGSLGLRRDSIDSANNRSILGFGSNTMDYTDANDPLRQTIGELINDALKGLLGQGAPTTAQPGDNKIATPTPGLEGATDDTFPNVPRRFMPPEEGGMQDPYKGQDYSVFGRRPAKTQAQIADDARADARANAKTGTGGKSTGLSEAQKLALEKEASQLRVDLGKTGDKAPNKAQRESITNRLIKIEARLTGRPEAAIRANYAKNAPKRMPKGYDWGKDIEKALRSGVSRDALVQRMVEYGWTKDGALRKVKSVQRWNLGI